MATEVEHWRVTRTMERVGKKIVSARTEWERDEEPAEIHKVIVEPWRPAGFHAASTGHAACRCWCPDRDRCLPHPCRSKEEVDKDVCAAHSHVDPDTVVGHVHEGEWCARCVEHGVVEEVRRARDLEATREPVDG